MRENTEEGETSDPSLFPAAITKVAVAQICQSIGFASSQRSALEALSNIATRYLQSLAKSASSNANSCGRTECNLFDVICAIEDMSSVQGFHGASDVKKSLFSSEIIREIMSFVRWVDEIPFAKPIPREITAKRTRFYRSSIERRQDLEQNPPFSHIPAWLPPLPDPSTYESVGVGVLKGELQSLDEQGHDRESDQIVVDVSATEKHKNWEEKRLLPVERPRVKFKLGLGLGFGVEVGLRNGICRGGKRVSWHSRNDEDQKSSSPSSRRRK